MPAVAEPVTVADIDEALALALAHATAAPVRDWTYIDALLDAYLDSVRGT